MDAGSKIAARYVAVFGTENERQIAKASGAEIEDEEPEPIAPVECYRCKRETPRSKDRCQWCGQVLTPAAVEKVKKDEGEIRRGVLSLVRADPELVDQIQRSERVMDVLSDRPELEEEIVAMADVLGG